VSVLESVPLEDRLAVVVADRFGEEALRNPLRWPGSGVIGDDSIEEVSGDVAGVLRRLLEIDEEKSESSAERKEAFDEVVEMDRMSGAFSA
jgi:hypothetical protein